MTKITLTAVVLVLAGIRSLAQPNVPEMPVWFDCGNTPYGVPMYALPDFDSANHGEHALCLWRSGHSNATWYNRFPGDTTNSFDWGVEILDLVKGDFNGDGIPDYSIGAGHTILFGNREKSPPMDPPFDTKQSTIIASRPSYCGDFNHDGIDDILSRANNQPDVNPYLANIMFGNRDITKLHYTVLPTPFNSSISYCLSDCYTNSAGEFRIITFSCTYNSAGDRVNPTLTLWKINMRDSLGVTLLSLQYLNSTTFEGVNEYVVGFHDYQNNRHTIDCNRHVFSLDSDSFSLCHTNGGGGLRPFFNRRAGQFEWVGSYVALNKKDSLIVHANIHIGNPRIDTVPLCRFTSLQRVPSVDGGDTMNLVLDCVNLGDLDGDGLPEFAVVTKNYTRRASTTTLKILKTVQKLSDVKPSKPKPLDDESDFMRNVRLDGRKLSASLRGNGSSSANIQLYDITGRMLISSPLGILSPFEKQVEIDLSSVRLVEGLYFASLVTGTRTEVKQVFYLRDR